MKKKKVKKDTTTKTTPLPKKTEEKNEGINPPTQFDLNKDSIDVILVLREISKRLSHRIMDTLKVLVRADLNKTDAIKARMILSNTVGDLRTIIEMEESKKILSTLQALGFGIKYYTEFQGEKMDSTSNN